MIDTVIFDMDGTLLDTLEDLKESTNSVLKKMEFPTRTKEEIKNFVGNGVELLFKRALPENIDNNILQEAIKNFKAEYQKNMYNNTKPYDGIINLLEYLKNKNIKTGVVSNKFDAAVKQMSEKYFKNLIDISVGQSENIPKKPNPQGVLKAINDLGAKSAIYVGDSDVDVQTAKNSNLKCIGVTWGFRSIDFLKGADYIANYPDEIIEILRSI